MRVQAERDKLKKELGYALISVSDLTFSGQTEEVSFFIQRAGGKSLGSEGWQVSDARLKPDQIEQVENGLRLFVGPAIVDHMEPLENYRFGLVLADGDPLTGTLVWQNIPKSPLSDRICIAGVTPQNSPISSPPKPILQEHNAVTPSVETDVMQLTVEVEKSSERSPSTKFIILVVGITVLLLVIGMVFYLTRGNKTPIIPGPPPREEQAKSGDGSQTPSLERAREALKNRISPEEALALGKKFLEVPGNPDAAYLLLEDAGEKGNAEAAFWVGRFFDPTYTEPTGTIKKNPANAHEWYNISKSGGFVQAESQLTALRQWVEQKASQGVPLAQEALSKWEK